MSTAVTTLADFLLARIAEDEKPAFELIPYECEPGCCAPAGWVGHRCLICGTVEFGGTVEAITEIAEEHDKKIHRRSRVLAECAAKRRIVERESNWRVPKAGVPTVEVRTWDDDTMLVNGELMPITEFNERFTEAAPPSETLKLLALPYADHADYREEWRP